MRKLTFINLFFIMTLALFAHGGSDYKHSDFLEGMQEGDKAAILMVHFGTTHDDTRQRTIDALNIKAKGAFPELDVREAYTSRIVAKRLGDRGIVKQNPQEVLNQLHADGYTHILIQSSTIIDGVEMESLNRDVQELAPLFKEVRVGTPLLYSPDSYQDVIDALTINSDSTKAYVWVGHGTYDASTAQYAMLDYMFKANGYINHIVGTVEGYPSFDDAVNQLQATNLKEVVLAPFMFVAGEHAKNDIAGDWKDGLEEKGFSVEVDNLGLGENTTIQDIYIAKLKFMLHHKKIDIMDKKAVYSKTGEKKY